MYVCGGWCSVFERDVWDVRVPDGDGWKCGDDVFVVRAVDNDSWRVFRGLRCVAAAGGDCDGVWSGIGGDGDGGDVYVGRRPVDVSAMCNGY